MIFIDTNTQFPHLSRAPIVEAVIEMRSSPERQWEEQSLLNILKERLPDYPKAESRRGFVHTFSMGPDQKPRQDFSDLGIKGFKLISDDKLRIIVFGRDNFAFSRLSPYENWDRFSAEALRLWSLYKELTGSIAINRLGVRFINRISLPAGDVRFEEYLQSPPQPPSGIDLPFVGFFHQDMLAVPNYGYNINFLQTTQQSPDGGLHLILDIDVFTEKPVIAEKNNLLRNLEEMRYLKNKIFFNSITNKTLELLK